MFTSLFCAHSPLFPSPSAVPRPYPQCPLLRSPNLTCTIRAAAWSPTRPSVFVLARSDGFLEVRACALPHPSLCLPSSIGRIALRSSCLNRHALIPADHRTCPYRMMPPPASPFSLLNPLPPCPPPLPSFPSPFPPRLRARCGACSTALTSPPTSSNSATVPSLRLPSVQPHSPRPGPRAHPQKRVRRHVPRTPRTTPHVVDHQYSNVVVHSAASSRQHLVDTTHNTYSAISRHIKIAHVSGTLTAQYAGSHS